MKKIIVAITGGIAAYKSVILVRELRNNGFEVRVIMTPDAKHFITPLTLATLSNNPVVVENFNPDNGEWNSHVSLAEWADAMIIAPATANTIAKMAHGIADNLVLTTYLSSRCTVMIAPAMDLEMYRHVATRTNIELLKTRDVKVIEAEDGFLASGLEGKGRMAEPKTIVSEMLKCIDNMIDGDNQARSNGTGELQGKTVLITVGGTKEAIDPVRCITNHSTGKMGFALVKEIISRGAKVILVKGATTEVTPTNKNIIILNVSSAEEMYCAVKKSIESSDINIFAAAVADYTPVHTANKKIKYNSDNITIELRPTKDIAAQMGKIKRKNQINIGFALETDNALENAKNKLVKKNLDAIVVNSLEDKGSGFAIDTNKITILAKKNMVKYPLQTKDIVAKNIVDFICNIPTINS